LIAVRRMTTGSSPVLAVAIKAILHFFLGVRKRGNPWRRKPAIRAGALVPTATSANPPADI